MTDGNTGQSVSLFVYSNGGMKWTTGKLSQNGQVGYFVRHGGNNYHWNSPFSLTPSVYALDQLVTGKAFDRFQFLNLNFSISLIYVTTISLFFVDSSNNYNISI